MARRPRLSPAERYVLLRGEDLERYAQTSSRLVLAARLNKWYPDPFGCADRFRLMAPSVRRGLYGGVRIDRTTGLPRLKDVLTVQVDREIAGEFLAAQEARAASGRSLTPRVAAKVAYYRELVKVHLPPIHHLSVRLRRVYPGRGCAAFEVVFDRLDAAEGYFVRYTLLLEQTDRVWGSRLLERSGDYTKQTQAFRETMDKFAQDESEIMFLLLGKLEGVRVEEVSRGRIGPLWSPWSPAPPGWSPRDASDAFILHCPLDRASTGHEVDLDNDPFSTLFRDFLSDASRPVIDEAVRRFRYRVHKERKFACTKPALPALRIKLMEAGTNNVVYAA
ncbi:MAG: hypothetical protein ABII00_02670 [Elusimicrobiota bacterium]